jgi:hypothetical protein
MTPLFADWLLEQINHGELRATPSTPVRPCRSTRDQRLLPRYRHCRCAQS